MKSNDIPWFISVFILLLKIGDIEVKTFFLVDTPGIEGISKIDPD